MSKLQNSNHLAECIEQGLIKLGMQPADMPVDRYIAYLELLHTWNKAYNLTAIDSPERMVTHHILDSLSVLRYLKGEYCVDVGTGAGLPGLILALALPGKEWVLLDSNQKKIRFLNQVIIELGINNVSAIKARVEEFKPKQLFTTIITRAYGSLALIYEQTQHLLSPGGNILAMKGHLSNEELDGIHKSTLTVQLHKLHVPDIKEQRTLVEISVLPTSD